MPFRKMTTLGVIALSVALAPRAQALPGEQLQNVELGQSSEVVTQALSAQNTGARLEQLSVSAPHQYAEALLHSDFLAALNRAGAKHALLDEPMKNGVRFIRLRSEKSTLMLGFANDKLNAAFLKAQIPPDQTVGGADNRFQPDRLAPLRNFLATMSGCDLEGDKTARNQFVHHGTCPSAQIYVEYRPEVDEFWVLYFGGTPTPIPVPPPAP